MGGGAVRGRQGGADGQFPLAIWRGRVYNNPEN